jgi:hypothetical protein
VLSVILLNVEETFIHQVEEELGKIIHLEEANEVYKEKMVKYYAVHSYNKEKVDGKGNFN